MITEGYTGIKKAKFITRTSEGAHTIRCDSNNGTRELKISFSIHSEKATEHLATEAAS